MSPPSHPLAGTIMVGSVEGYFEPEWSEDCAYGSLLNIVMYHFVDFDGEDLVPTRRIRGPHDVFAAADDMLREMAQ
jgi:hypothetical protein